MNLTNISEFRYSTKEFNKEKKIDKEKWQQVEDLLRLSPSSTNAQPWHFIIASTEEGKKRVAVGTEGSMSFNTPKIMDASHVVVFCTRKDLTEEYLLHVLDKEDEDGRYPDKSYKPQMHEVRSMFVNLHKEAGDVKHWNEKQVYLSGGAAMLGAAALGIDSVPMEGVNIEEINKEFGLEEKGFTASFVVSFGYRSENDFNANLPKSRLSGDEVFLKV
ncbi:MAG: oxygen-insensitive NAD(P)H nitroreductase [Bdellovibrionota bacterium]|nr:oxygen-insensitive NAD(P)H nitroreductase [Bdellovibrionota bacterium]